MLEHGMSGMSKCQEAMKDMIKLKIKNKNKKSQKGVSEKFL